MGCVRDEIKEDTTVPTVITTYRSDATILGTRTNPITLGELKISAKEVEPTWIHSSRMEHSQQDCQDRTTKSLSTVISFIQWFH